MADFTPKKVSTEKGKAKPGLGVPSGSSAEHQAPPHIYLEHHHLEKLGLKSMPKVGSKIKISGLAHVGATSEHDHSREAPHGSPEGSGKRRSMTLHLHKMDIGHEGISEVDQEEQSKKGAKAAMDKALSKGAGSEKEDGEED